MQIAPPGVHFFPRQRPALDRQQRRAVFADLYGDRSLAQRADAAEQQADQVHGMFGADRPAGASILFHAPKLRQHVVVVGLVHLLGKEPAAQRSQLHGDRRGISDQRRVQALQHCRVRLQRQAQELREFPETLLGGVILDLLRHAGQRPVQPCRGKVDAAHIGIRVGVIEAIRARADDTTINDR